MRHQLNETIPGAASPWGTDVSRVYDQVNEQVQVDGLAVGVLHSEHPQPDELLVVHGWSDSQMRQWLAHTSREDKLLRAAMNKGVQTISPRDNSGITSPLIRDKHAMMHVQPESMSQSRWWWLIMTRQDRPFSDDERQLAALLLRRWQTEFSQTDEPGMGRLLVGHDNRLLLADLSSQDLFVRQPGVFEQLTGQLMPLIGQRFPNLPDDATRDAALVIANKPHWITFRRNRAIPGPDAEHWYIELRPLEDEKLPTVGVVEDDRIARALAHIHENFHNSPSLAEIARQAHISPFHFHRLFTKQVGVSPKQYLQRKQLQVARWLLRSTRLPISVIAQRTGFASHGHFTSTFHRLVGISPRQYRELRAG